MESQGDVSYYIGIINGDIDIDSPFLGISQNNLMSFSDSPPQVENASSKKEKRGSNFSVEEDQLLLSVCLEVYIVVPNLWSHKETCHVTPVSYTGILILTRHF